MISQEEKGSKYRNVLLTAKRARQLQGGAVPLVDSRSTKACRVAQDEVAAGMISDETVGWKPAGEQEPPPEN